MAPKPPQFLLADLAAVIAVCGLILGLFQSPDARPNVGVVMFLIWSVVIAWIFFRAWRAAPSCDECGRRFIAQKPKQTTSMCEECGQLQRGPARVRKAWAIAFWGVLALLALGVVVMTSVKLDSISWLPRSQVTFYLFALPTTMILLCSLCAVLGIALVVFDYGPLKPMSCEKCGAVVPREKSTGPLLCPQCRLQHLPRKQVKIEGPRATLLLFAALSIVGILAGLMLGGSVGSSSGVGFWTILPLSIVATIVTFFAVLFARIARIGLRAHRLKSEPYVLKLAARCAGEEGDVARSVTTTVWWSGPKNPSAEILEQMESARGRLQSFIASEIDSPPFLRILCFHKRSGFDAFVGPFTIATSYYVKYMSGLYFGAPHRILALCDEELPFSISDQDTTRRSQFCSYFMESLHGSPLAIWVREGLVRCLGGADHDLAPLYRKILASFAKGTTLGIRLVESWREWAHEQGIGVDSLPPSHIEEQLLSRLIPLVENRQAKPNDRILAIRNMGFQGCALGADELIGLLRSDDAIPTREITWALEAISGMAYGDDPDRWREWWNTLPTEIRHRRCQREDVSAVST